MYQSRNLNLLSIACPLIFLATVYVPTPVQSQHPYELVSAIVDRENPRNGQDVFTLNKYTKIEFAYVDDGISQVWASKGDGTEKTARFPSLDYHIMISDIVIFDTGDSDRMVLCQFKNRDSAKEFYGFFKPRDYLFYSSKNDIISVLQYDYNEAGRGNGPRDDRSSDDNYHHVSAEGRICIEILTRSEGNRPLTRRFIIVGNDRTTKMVFTSKTFNTALVGNREYVVMRINNFSSEILIQFKDEDTALRFSAYVRNNSDIDRRILLNTSDSYLKSIFGNRFQSE